MVALMRYTRVSSTAILPSILIVWLTGRFSTVATFTPMSCCRSALILTVPGAAAVSVGAPTLAPSA